MDRIKIFLDSNAYNKLIQLDISFLKNIEQKCTIYYCDTIEFELSNMKTTPEKKELLNKILEQRQRIDSKSQAFFAFCSYDNIQPENGTGFRTYDNSDKIGGIYTYCDAEYKEKIEQYLNVYGRKKKANHDNKNDAKIALMAKKNNCILITYDGVNVNTEVPRSEKKDLGLYQAINQYYKGKAMTFNEFHEHLQKF